MPEIKTRDAIKGSIKALDKSAVVSKRMKDSLVKVKEKSENIIRAKESSPEEYAGDKITRGSEEILYGGVRLAEKSFRDGKKAASDAKRSVEERKAEHPRNQADRKSVV